MKVWDRSRVLLNMNKHKPNGLIRSSGLNNKVQSITSTGSPSIRIAFREGIPTPLHQSLINMDISLWTISNIETASTPQTGHQKAALAA